MDHNSIAEEWFHYAISDFAAAKFLALNKICAKYNPRFSEITEECVNLTDYGVQTRYPFELEIHEEDMVLAIESAETIKAFVTQLNEE